jgi:hypothetical protein
LLALAGPGVAAVAVRILHAADGRRRDDTRSREESRGGLVADTHVVVADCLPRVSASAVRVNHAADGDGSGDDCAGEWGRSSDANVAVVADLSVCAVSVRHSTNFDRGGRGRRGRRSCNANVALTDLAVLAVGVGFAADFDGRAR